MRRHALKIMPFISIIKCLKITKQEQDMRKDDEIWSRLIKQNGDNFSLAITDLEPCHIGHFEPFLYPAVTC